MQLSVEYNTVVLYLENLTNQKKKAFAELFPDYDFVVIMDQSVSH